MKRSTVFAVVLCALFLSAGVFAAKVEIGKNREILVDGKPFFPIMQWAQSKGKMAEQKSVGFNVFFGQGDSSKPKEYCDEAKKNGAYAIVHYKSDEVSNVKDHPALLGWLYVDEPDMEKNGKAPRIPMSDSISAYEGCKAKDSQHLMFLTLTTGYVTKTEDRNSAGSKGKDLSFYKQYAKATDAIGYDTYPIYGNNKPEALWWVAEAAKELGEIMERKKPMFAWIESSGGSKWITPSKQRHPLPFEIRAEVWMAIINGCNAIGYFTHSWVAPDQIGNPNSRLKRGESKYYTQYGVPKNNEEEITKINKQITRLTNPLCSADISGKVTVDSKEIEFLVKEFDKKMYIFAVNMKRGDEKAKFTVVNLKENTKIKVDEEERDIEAKAGEFEDNFKEHAVHIYVISLE